VWWLAWAGDELAGFVSRERVDRYAVIASLAVRPPYRGCGLGRALLMTAFVTLRDHGHTRVRLEVDAQNVTGAVRVNEAAGMTVERRFDVLEKALA
jgi:ribosomal protein S18 acetylase RimI-like enzyme